MEIILLLNNILQKPEDAGGVPRGGTVARINSRIGKIGPFPYIDSGSGHVVPLAPDPLPRSVDNPEPWENRDPSLI